MVGMATYEKIKGLISLASNSPWAPTGYGMQANHLVDHFVRHGIRTAVLSNYGQEGHVSEYRTKHGNAMHYPKGLTPYSEDVFTLYHNEHRKLAPELPHALMTLYDVWVYKKWKDTIPVISWVPLDHITLPPDVAEWLKRENVTPVAMAPHGQRQMAAAGIDSVYIPHAIDTNVFKKTPKVTLPDGSKMATREMLEIDDDTFLVTMVAANKANGLVHRKAYSENLTALAMFLTEYPNTHIYLHTDPAPFTGGFDLGVMLKSLGIPADKVTIANRDKLRIGYSQEDLAAIYTASDVLLAPSYGEGFGVPQIEAQAAGCRVIGSSWAAAPDLIAEDGWLVEGQPFWDQPQKAWFQIPHVPSIVKALEEAYKAERGFSATARKFALQFDVEKVWEESWMPFLKDYFAKA